MKNIDINIEDIRPIIQLALNEDIGNGDITTNAIFSGSEMTEAVIITKEDAVFAGGPVVEFIYNEIDTAVNLECLKNEGEKIHSGDELIIIKGPANRILIGERIALNFLGHMCGVAAATRRMSSLLEGTSIKLLDTRKTIPGFRILDKYAVKAGGGDNHRMGLYDMVLIKDNHIKAAGSITEAINKIKTAYNTKFKIEVETTNLDEVKEALKGNVDIIMLDNMDREMMKEAISLINCNAKIEISGNVDEERITEIRDLKIDYISSGAITHSVKTADLSMRFK